MTGGRWDIKSSPLFFLVIPHMGYKLYYHKQWLIPANIIGRHVATEHFEQYTENPTLDILLDSGAFTTASTYARKSGIPLGEAFKIPPAQLPGYNELLALYTKVVKQRGHLLWGYIELDLGSTADRDALRAQQADDGIVPIPVYHPLTDPYEYFDQLASTHDRVCIGGIVGAEPNAKRIALADIAYRRNRRYPHVWLHALGQEPSPLLTAFEYNSADTSGWASPFMYGTGDANAALRATGLLDSRFIADLAVNGGVAEQTRQLSEYNGWLGTALAWRDIVKGTQQL